MIRSYFDTIVSTRSRFRILSVDLTDIARRSIPSAVSSTHSQNILNDMLGTGLKRQILRHASYFDDCRRTTDDDLFNTFIEDSSTLPKKLTIAYPACVDSNLNAQSVVLLQLDLGRTDEDGLPSGEDMVLKVVSGECAILPFPCEKIFTWLNLHFRRREWFPPASLRR